jgi:hypothetical protein
LNPIHKVSPRATIFAAGVESASTARNSSSVLLTVKSPFVQEYFALSLLCVSLPLLFSAYLLNALAFLFDTTHSLAFAFRHEAPHCLCFAYRGKSDPSDLRLSTPLRCAFQLSLAFAPRCTAVTTVPLLSKLVSTMPLPSYAHISAPLQIISLP